MNKSTSSLDKKRFEVEIYTNHKWVKKIFIIEDDRVTLCSKILIKKDLNNSRIDDIPLQEMFQKVLKNPNKSKVQEQQNEIIVDFKNNDTFSKINNKINQSDDNPKLKRTNKISLEVVIFQILKILSF